MTRKRRSGNQLARNMSAAPALQPAPAILDSLPQVWLSQEQFAQLVGLSDRHCRKLAHEGKLPMGQDGRFDAIRASLALAAYYVSGRSESDAQRYAKAKADKEESKARREKVNADLDEGRVIQMDTARQLFSRAAAATRVRMRAISTAASPKLVGLDVTEIEIRLRAEIDGALEQLNRTRLNESNTQ